MLKLGNWTDGECYYVSVVDGPRFGLLAGPYRTHREALERVDEAQRLANEHNDRACWYAYGTVKMPDGKRQGVLNHLMTAENLA